MTAIPVQRIHLRMEGNPQETAEPATLLLTEVLRYCAQPETFPAFLAHARQHAKGEDWILALLASLTPETLAGLELMIVAGLVADVDGAT